MIAKKLNVLMPLGLIAVASTGIGGDDIVVDAAEFQPECTDVAALMAVFFNRGIMERLL